MSKRKRPKPKRPRKIEAVGDCGEKSFEYLNVIDHTVVAHGYPLGTGGNADGMRYWHAWLETEDGMLVLDMSNGHNAAFLREDYYEAGSIDPAHVTRYTREEANFLVDSEGHHGPWDGITNPYIGTGVPVEEDYE
jgi:hypothetical protein